MNFSAKLFEIKETILRHNETPVRRFRTGELCEYNDILGVSNEVGILFNPTIDVGSRNTLNYAVVKVESGLNIAEVKKYSTVANADEYITCSSLPLNHNIIGVELVYALPKWLIAEEALAGVKILSIGEGHKINMSRGLTGVFCMDNAILAMHKATNYFSNPRWRLFHMCINSYYSELVDQARVDALAKDYELLSGEDIIREMARSNAFCKGA